MREVPARVRIRSGTANTLSCRRNVVRARSCYRKEKGAVMQWRRVGRGATIGAVAAGVLVISAAAASADINQGDHGKPVWCVQHVVHTYAGISIGPSGEDSDFGPGTKRGVVTYQTQMGVDHDGQVGPVTGHVMFQDVTNVHRIAKQTGDTQLSQDTGSWLSDCPRASSYFK
jgi:peptidoglycan hydrolase-like protein with peptidoglycan-binding domain